MAKYILKESELRAIISEAVTEELGALLNEGLPTALGNTLKYGALGVFAPAILAGKALKKTDAIINGNDTITGTIRDYFGADSKDSSGRRLSKSEKQRQRLSDTRGISYEYGRPETVPGMFGKTKLAKKEEIVAPDLGHGVVWGDFGKHYHDEGDRFWTRKVTDTENALIRNSSGNPRRQARLQKRYKRILVDWLKDRDRAYETYIKGQN